MRIGPLRLFKRESKNGKDDRLKEDKSESSFEKRDRHGIFGRFHDPAPPIWGFCPCTVTLDLTTCATRHALCHTPTGVRSSAMWT